MIRILEILFPGTIAEIRKKAYTLGRADEREVSKAMWRAYHKIQEDKRKGLVQNDREC